MIPITKIISELPFLGLFFDRFVTTTDESVTGFDGEAISTSPPSKNFAYFKVWLLNIKEQHKIYPRYFKSQDCCNFLH